MNIDDFAALEAYPLPDDAHSELTVGDVRRITREARRLIDEAQQRYLEAVRTIAIIVKRNAPLRIDPRDVETLHPRAQVISVPDWEGGTTLYVSEPEQLPSMVE